MKKLKQYLKDKNKTEFARELGVTKMAVHHWETGKVNPREKMMYKIEEKTNGHIKPADWFDK